MMQWSRSEIEEELLTLEDAALLADPVGQIPEDTLERLRHLVRTDPRVIAHYEYLEALAEEAGLPAVDDRLHIGLRCLEEVELLARAEDWHHPREVLDPTGEIGISYSELVQLVAMRARQSSAPDRYEDVRRRLERAWSEEKAGEEMAKRFAEQLSEYEPAVASRLLRQATRHYESQRLAEVER